MAGTPLRTAQLVLGALALFGTGLTYSSFSTSTASTANRFAAGTVSLGDNDVESAMLMLTDAQPGGTDTGCIRVLYTGSLPAGVRLHATTGGALAPYLNVVVTRGVDNTPAFDSCSGFVADTTDYLGFGQGVVYSGTLAAFPSSWATGVQDASTSAPETWTAGEARSYRIAVTLGADTGAQGKSANASFFWDARNL